MTEEKLPIKKNAPRKAPSTKKVETAPTDIVSNVEQPTVQKSKVKLTGDTKIPVMNNTTGRYGYAGRSGYSFELEEYGDIAEVPFSELQAMRSSSHKRHLEDAFIIILDTEAVEELNYTKLYEHVLDENSVNELLTSPDRLEETLTKMPIIMRETVVAIAKQKYINRTLFDLRVIETIEKCLNVKIIE